MPSYFKSWQEIVRNIEEHFNAKKKKAYVYLWTSKELATLQNSLLSLYLFLSIEWKKAVLTSENVGVTSYRVRCR